jgi:hypothetical protein
MKNLEELINSYPTNSEYGFTEDEIKEFIALNVKQEFSLKHYYGAMQGNTCILVNDKIVNYHCDVLSAIRCGIDKRGLTNGEWD